MDKQGLITVQTMEKVRKLIAKLGYFSLIGGAVFSPEAIAQSSFSWKIQVNTHQDGNIRPDQFLTLREAIEISNGTLPVNQLSQTEKQFVTASEQPKIIFNLPQPNPSHSQAATILLERELPPILKPGLVIDGTTQPGYAAATESSGSIAPPMIAITPAGDRPILRGLTLSANQITLKGLSISGFQGTPSSVISTLESADIVITSPPQNFSQTPVLMPQKITLENNWLGLHPQNQENKNKPSRIGVYLDQGQEVTIRNNRISNHQSVGIYTGRNAINTIISKNILENNGFAGIPHTIHLEGNIQGSKITENVIQNNAGSGIFTFKSTGNLEINQNQFLGNGQSIPQAAIYLMGSNHQIQNNRIANHRGPGIVIAAFPESYRNIITNNQFSNLQGLSIDLLTQQNTGLQNNETGDGLNPKITHWQQRRKTANLGMNAPNFASSEFYWHPQTKTVTVLGETLANATLEIYRISESGQTAGPLNQKIGLVTANNQGFFTFKTSELKPGDKISATATLLEYGTSEPARNALIKSLP